MVEMLPFFFFTQSSMSNMAHIIFGLIATRWSYIINPAILQGKKRRQSFNKRQILFIVYKPLQIGKSQVELGQQPKEKSNKFQGSF